MKLIIPILLLTVFNTALAVTSPTSLKLHIYQVAVALSNDCSSPQVIFSSTTGAERDFISSPVLGSGSLANGTYNCVMITMNDVIKFTPSANDGATCTGGTEYAIDLCRTTASSGNEPVWSTTDLLEGTTTTSAVQCSGTSQVVGSGGVANKVTLYLRTNSLPSTNPDAQYTGSWLNGSVAAFSVDGGNGPSVARENGIQLTAPFVVSGTAAGTFYLDARNKVDGTGGNCEMNAPEFGFR